MKPSGNPSLAKVCLLALMFVSYTDTYVLAAPKGGHVVSGSASFTQEGNLTVITAGNRSIINYDSFNIASGETVRFVQPNSGSSVLNRVTSPNPTNIFGSLQANGNVYIVNPYGVFFQNGAVLNVGGLYAGAGKLNDQDFTHGRIHFTDLAGDVRNDGVLAADNRIVLMGTNVTNNGTMTSTRGLATMVSGKDVYVGERNSNVFVQASGKTGSASSAAGSVTNNGTVSAPRVLLGAGDLYSTAIVNSGLLKGQSITVNAGRNGTATVGGRLDATSAAPSGIAKNTGKGGNIQVLGGTVALKGATLDASGAAGGGVVRVGGDWHGGGTLAHANATTLDTGTTIKADATGTKGDGGSVVVWSDQGTFYGGNISARGGSAGGNGGSAEVSSHNELIFRGTADLTAAKGRTGSLLLDPSDITISDTGADYVGLTTLNPTVDFGDGNGATPASTAITIPVTTPVFGLNAVLATANVTLRANNDIFVYQSIAPGLGTRSLELDAGRSIFIGDATHPNITITLGGAFTARFDDTAATQSIRGPALGNFSMGTGSSITAPGGITITDTATGASQSTSTTAGTISLTSLSAPSGLLTLTNLYSDAVVTGNTITASGTLSTNATANATAGGTINLMSSGGISVAALSASGLTTGAGGSISLTGAGDAVTTGTITTSSPGAGSGGAVTLASNGGTLTTGAITVNSGGAGTGGTVQLNSTGNLNAGAVSAMGGAGGTGGGVTLTSSGGSVTTAGINATGGATDAGVGLGESTALAINGDIFGGSLTTTGTGPITFNSATVLTTGPQTYAGPVVINVPTLGLTATTGAITFSRTVDGTTAATNSLAITTPGNEVFNGAVGSQVALVDLSTDATGTVGGQTRFNMALPTATANLAGVNLSGALTVNDTVRFNLTGTPGVLAPSVATGGLQTYAGTASVLSDTYLKSGSTLLVGGALTGSGPPEPVLTLNTAGAITLGGLVSGLTSFTTVGGQTLNMNGGGVTTDGAGGQTYSGPVVLGADATLTANSTGAIAFNSTVNGAHALSFDTGSVTTFAGNVGDAVHLTTLTALNGSATSITGGGAVSTDGNQNFSGVLTLGLNTTLTSMNGTVSAGSLTGNAHNLNVTATGSTFGTITNGGALTFADGAGVANFGGDIGATSFNSTGAGGVTFSTGLTVTTTGTQDYTGPLTLGGTTTLTTGGASAITVGSLTGSANDLTVTASSSTLGAITNGGNLSFADGAGTATFNGTVGAVSLTRTGTGLTDINAASITTASTTGQSYGGPVRLELGTTLSDTLLGPITFSGAINGASAGAQTLTAVTGGTTTFGGTVGLTNALGSLTVGSAGVNGGTTVFNSGGAAVTTLNDGSASGTGTQSYFNSVQLGLDTTLISNFSGGGAAGGNITFNGKLDSATATQLAIAVNTSGNEIFNGLVGSVHPLRSLATDTSGSVGGQVQFNMSLAGQASGVAGVRLGTDGLLTNDLAVFNVAGSSSAKVPISVSGVAGTNNPSITSTGSQSQFYLGGVTDLQDTVIQGPKIVVNGTFDAGGKALTFDLSQQALVVPLTLAGATFTNLASLASVGDAGTTLNGNLTTNGYQYYGSTAGTGGVTLGSDVVLTSSGGAIIGFGGTVDGAHNLTVNTAGDELFNGLVGNTTPLTSLNTDATGTVGGTAKFNMDAMGLTAGKAGVTATTVLVNDAVAFNVTGTVAGPVATAVSSVRTNDEQIYFSTATLGQNTVLTDTGAGIEFASTTNGTFNLTLNASGEEVFLGRVGGVNPLLSLTTNGGTAIFNFVGSLAAPNVVTLNNVAPAGTATGGQTYNSAVLLFADTVLSSTFTSPATGGGAIVFNGAVDGFGGPVSLTVLAGPGQTVFAPGATVNAAGLNVGGAQVTFNQPVGATTALNVLTIGRNGALAGVTPSIDLNNGSISTTSGQTYTDAVFLSANTTLADPNPQTIAFNSTVDSLDATPRSLTLNTAGTVTFSGVIGGIHALSGLSSTATVGTTFGMTLAGTTPGVTVGTGGVTVTGPAIFSAANSTLASLARPTLQSGGAITLNGAVTLNSDTSLYGTGSGDITFGGAINGAHGLALNTAGNEIFNPAAIVGRTTPLTSLTTDALIAAGGRTQFLMDVSGAVSGVAGVRVGASGLAVHDGVLFNVAGASLVNPTVLTLNGGTQAYSGAASIAGGTFLVGDSSVAVPSGGVYSGGGAIGFGSTVAGSAATPNLTIRTGAGQTTFLNTVNVSSLQVTGATVTFNGAVSSLNVLSIAPNPGAGTGSIDLNGGTVTTATGQTYGSPVTLSANTILTDTVGSAIVFGSTLDGGFTLAVNTSGNTVFGGAVGGIAPLVSLTTDAPGATLLNGGAVSTTGLQSYNDAVTLGAATTLASANTAGDGGAIRFGKTLDGGFTLAVNTSGSAVFGGAVGGATPLVSLTTDAPGATLLNGGAVSTTGLQSYNDAVTLGAATTLASANTAGDGGAIRFGKTLDGGFTLAVNTSGSAVFGGAVGGIAPLVSLTTDASGATLLDGGAVSTTGLQSYNDAVTLGAATTLASANTAGDGGAIRFGKTLDGGFALTVNASGGTVIGGLVGSIAPLVSVNVPTGPVSIVGPAAGAAITTTGMQNYGGTVTASVPVTFNAGGAAGLTIGSLVSTAIAPATSGVVINSTRSTLGPVNLQGVLTVTDTAGSAIFSGAVATAGSVTVTASGGINLNGGSVASVGGQTYNSATLLGATTSLTDSGSGDITFASTLNSAGAQRALTVNTGGNEIFNGLVGNAIPLLGLVTDAGGSLGGQTRFNMVLTGQPSGTAGVRTGTGGVTVNAQVVFNVAGSSSAKGPVDLFGAAGNDLPSVSSTGPQQYLFAGGQALGNTDTVLQGPTVSFAGGYNGMPGATPHSLTLDLSATFNLALTGFQGINNFASVGTGGTQISGTFGTVGFQYYGNAVTLTGASSLSSTGGKTLRFDSTVDGGFALVLNTAGDEVFNGLVGSVARLGSLTVDASIAPNLGTTRFGMDLTGQPVGTAGVKAGSLTINDATAFNVTGSLDSLKPSVNTTGRQLYNGVTVLGKDTILTSLNTAGDGGAVAFGQTVDGAFSLTINTGGVTAFNGKVGGSTALTQLTTDAAGSTQFNMNAAAAGVNPAGVNVTQSVFINDPVTFNVVNSSSARPSVQAGLAQRYNGAAALAANTVLSVPSVTGSLSLNSTVDGNFSLTLNTTGTGSLGGAVGGIVPLASLTTDIGGDTLIAGGVVNTAGGAQTYNDAVTIGQDTTLATRPAGSGIASGDIVFNSTLDGSHLLSLNSGGQSQFKATVGRSLALTGLTINSAANPGAGTSFAFDVGTGSVGVLVNGAVAIYDPVTFQVTGSSLAHPTVLTLGNGTQTYAGAVNLAASAVFISSSISGVPNIYANGGAITFSSPAGISSSGGSDLYVRTGAGTLTFGSAVNVGNLDFGAAQVTFAGPITLPGLLSVEPNDGGTGGSILLNSGSLTTNGAQTYNAAVILGANTILTSLNTLGDGGSITFNSTIDGDGLLPRSLSVNTSGNTVFGGLVGGSTPLLSLTTDAPGATFLNGGGVITTGLQTYGDTVTLGNDTTLTSANIAGDGGAITFAQTVDGAFTLTLNTGGNTVFGGIVGGITPLASLTTDAPGATFLNGGSVTTDPKNGVPGSQTYNDAVFLGADTTLANAAADANGTIIFNATVDSSGAARALTLSSNFVQLRGAVGAVAPLFSLTITGNGTTLLNAGNVTTTAGQSYGSLAGTTIGASGSLFAGSNIDFLSATVIGAVTNMSAGADINFLSTLTGVSGGTDTSLTLLATNRVLFAGKVGGLPLTRLTVSAGTISINGGSVGTVLAQTYNGATTLGAATVFTSFQDGDIVFNGTLDGAHDTSVVTGGVTAFNGKVGGTTALTSLTTDAPGSTQFNLDSVGGTNPAGVNVTGFVTINDPVRFNIANSTTANPSVQTGTGAQTYNGAAFLEADTVLAAGSNANLVFNSTVDGAAHLGLNTGGVTILNGFVGGTTRLLGLTTDAGGSTRINGGGVATAGGDAQTYNDAVLLGADADLSSRVEGSTEASGNLVFNSTVDGPFILTLNSGGLSVFNAVVGSGTALAGLTINSANNPGAGTQFNMTVGAAAAAGVLVNGTVNVSDPVTFNVAGSSLTQPGVLTLGNGSQVYNGAVSLGTNTVLTSASGLPDASGAFADGGTIVFVSPAGISSNGGDNLSVRAGVGNVSFASAINVASLVLGGAQATFGGPVTLTGLLSVQPNDGGVGGSILLNGGSLTTAGAQTFNAPVILGAETLLTSLNSAGDGGSILFNSTVDGDGVSLRGLALNSPGDEVFNGIVGGSVPLASLTTDAPGNLGGATRFNMSLDGTAAGLAGVRVAGAVSINDAVVFNVSGNTLATGDHVAMATGGAQTYFAPATLSQDTALFSTGGGTLTFASTVDGGSGLALTTSGEIAFNGIVGGTDALSSLTANGGATRFNMSLAGLPTASAGVRIAGGLLVTGPVFFNVVGSSAVQPGVLTTGLSGQTYNGAATLLQDTVLTGGGANLVFNSSVDGTHALTLNTSGETRLGGPVGGTVPLLSLATDGVGNTTLSGGVRTTGFQTYGDAVSLLANVTVTSLNTAGDGGMLTFTKTVDGGFVLATSTGGNTNFNGPVGGGTPLVSLTTDALGTTFLNGGQVTTTGFQTYGNAVSLGVATTLFSLNTASDGGAITFARTVDGGAALNVNTSGNTVFNGPVGGGTPLASLMTDAPGMTFLNGGAITTTGLQTYRDTVLLGANLTLDSRNAADDGGGIIFAQSLNGGFALQTRASGDTVFGGPVGDTVALASLVTTAPGRTVVSGGGVTTAGVQTYNNALLLGANAVLTSLNTAGDGGALTFARTVDGGFALGVNTGGNTIFQGAVGSVTPLTSLTTDTPGATFLNGGAVTTAGAQTYGDSVQLGTNTLLTSLNTAGDQGGVTFAAALDGTVSLTVDTSGTTLFGGLVGNRLPLLNLTIASGAVNLRGGGVTTGGFQAYNGAVLLTGDAAITSLNTVGDDGSITFNQTVDGSFALYTNTRGTTTFGGFVGGSSPLASVTTGAITPGTVRFQGGGVTTSGAQYYGDVATLAAETTTFSSTDAGGVVFVQTVDGAAPNANALVLDSAGPSEFGDNVGAVAPLKSLFVTGPLTISGGSVTTSLDQRYQGALNLTPSATADTRLVSNSQNLRFEDNVSATGGLYVSGHRVSAERDIVTVGDLDLQTVNNGSNAPLLLLGGRNYISTGGNVRFNTLAASAPDASDGNATIVLSSSGKVLIQGGSFTMGYLQKVFSLGAVDIEVGRGVARVGDIAARSTIKIGASQIELLARPAVSTTGGRPNDGLNFVADNSIDFGSARIMFVGNENPTANFITTNGNTTIQRVTGISLFKDPNVDSQFRAYAGGFGGDEFASLDTPLQPLGGGSQALDTAAALSGALPDQKPVDVAAEITITASQMEELKKLGIHPRLAQKSERKTTGSKRALFAQLVDGQDPENYGRLQPIKGGISRLEPSDYVVVVDRMGEREVSSILKSFETVYGKNKEKAPEIGAAFQTAFTDYTVQKQTADPAGFGPFLADQRGKYPGVDKATRDFDDLFGHIEHLGLTDKEVLKSEEHIVSDLGVAGVSSTDMVKVINGLRKKLPPDQKAPSTKAPPSAPAASPAPGATAPATPPAVPASPEKKKAALKTATLGPPQSPARKSTHRPPVVRTDARHEMAGL